MDFMFVLLHFNSKVIKAHNNDNITILFWNSFWFWPLFGMGEGNSGSIKNKCMATCGLCTPGEPGGIKSLYIFPDFSPTLKAHAHAHLKI